MTNLKSDVFVSHIGLKRINLGGRDVDHYAALLNAEIDERKIIVNGVENTVRTAIIHFDSEEEMIGCIQTLVDLGIKFSDNEKSVAYSKAIRLKKRGDLTGLIEGC